MTTFCIHAYSHAVEILRLRLVDKHTLRTYMHHIPSTFHQYFSFLTYYFYVLIYILDYFYKTPFTQKAHIFCPFKLQVRCHIHWQKKSFWMGNKKIFKILEIKMKLVEIKLLYLVAYKLKENIIVSMLC